MAADGLGNVYVADQVNSRIQKFTNSGVYITKWGSAGSGNGQFSFPRTAAADRSGNVFVLFQGTSRIQRFTPFGCTTTNNTLACNDGNGCTAGDVCVGGACAGTPITTPPETQNLAAVNKTTYGWNAATHATSYDVVRGAVAALPVGPVGGDEVCFNNLPAPSLVDPTVPTVGTGLWYLSRGENTCGTGTLGYQGLRGAPWVVRSTTTCP